MCACGHVCEEEGECKVMVRSVSLMSNVSELTEHV